MHNTKEKILAVATKIFSRYGFYKTSMDEIARIAHKAKGSLYYHFASKEELFTEVVSREIEHMKKELSVIVTDTELDAKEKLKKYLLTRMAVLKQAANYHETLKADFFEHFEFIDKLRSNMDHWEKVQLRSIINQGIQEGVFAKKDKSTGVLLDVFIMVLKGLEIPFFLQDKYDELSPHFDDLINIIIKGMAPE
ncbi:TetR/AcrR family transcriptional regulator [Candidatus Sulfidibacterium hydrothermale]|jgi:AcrR family transcriptional regulator|uniref:TetR/AcrR family transcriptional regulator n=1 Tax=Candidatus Sulfidibacterium hydrothermale TaxID=2875962 RepID=UPI001F0AFAA3|nr:TetR/AcrR family transcriptional regulator [Candidatus Sulfidibacterium hydrothermale]UBM62136.1 TetR/AcrR family transcriptional regulator [Candidatus Sulfidibacterium hydrothermale]